MSADAIKGANPLKDDVLNTIQRPVKFGRGGKWEKDGMLQVQYHGIQQGDGAAVARSAPEIARPHQWVLRSVAGASIDFPAIVVSLLTFACRRCGVRHPPRSCNGEPNSAAVRYIAKFGP
jgi:hypothetical protein